MQTWTFGPGGIYTATWDGISKVTVTLTAGGQFVASFFAQSLTAAVASPEYQAILSPAPSGSPSLSLVATTGAAGFALQNGTPGILSWTAPNDGTMHRVLIFGDVNVTSAETGGLINVHLTDAGGTAGTLQLDAGAHGTGFFASTTRTLLVQAGSALTISQDSALTVGAAKLYAEIWAS